MCLVEGEEETEGEIPEIWRLPSRSWDGLRIFEISVSDFQAELQGWEVWMLLAVRESIRERSIYRPGESLDAQDSWRVRFHQSRPSES